MTEKCNKCGRERSVHNPRTGNKCDAAYFYVVHDYYGCDTGCCGHRVILCDESDNELDREWDFEHFDNNEEIESFGKQFYPNIPCRFDLCKTADGSWC
jgi:hypothetical protein